VIDVLVDRNRRLATLDSDGREMFISVGAAVFNLRLAVRAHGREARVRLMPDTAEPDLAARILLAKAAAAPAAVVALADTIPRRHTNRRPFADQRVPFAIMQELAGAAAAEEVDLLAVDPELRAGVLSLTRTAENRMRTTPVPG
jgi:hypothetical protein